MNYNQSEMTEKKYALSDVVTAVKARLNGKKYCSDHLRMYDEDSRFTLKELNDLVDVVVMDTQYWDGEFFENLG